MTSNFLGEVRDVSQTSRILSAAELIMREGVDLHKGMNYRDKGSLRPSAERGSTEASRPNVLSVFLVLRRNGEFKDEWNAKTQVFTYEGHDSTTVESGKQLDQIAMYESGKATDNGKFLKAANAFKDGIRKVPTQVQVYEKLDAGVWYDKGFFDLVDAKRVSEDGRMVFKFYLVPADAASLESKREPAYVERFLSTAVKEEVWKRDGGRCGKCRKETDLYFAGEGDDAAVIHLLCATHSGRAKRGLL